MQAKLLIVFSLINFLLNEVLCFNLEELIRAPPSEVKTFNCFTETYGSYLLRLQDSIEYYDKICGISTKPELQELFKYILYLDDFQSKLQLNSSLITNELIAFLRNSTALFPKNSNMSVYIQNTTNQMIEEYAYNIQQNSTNRDTFEKIKMLKKFIKKNINTDQKYSEFFVNNIRKLLKYRKEILTLSNALSNGYAKPTDCLPVDWDYMPVFYINTTDYIPEANKVECRAVNDREIKINPILIDQGGVAISFWVYENLSSLIKSNYQYMEILNGILNNKLILSYTLTKEVNISTINSTTYSVVHSFTINNSTVIIRSDSKCAEYVFVLIAIQKDCDKYKMIVSMRFPGSNSRQIFEKSLYANEIENLEILFNDNSQTTTVSKINYYKNFNYTESNELKMIYAKYDDIFINFNKEIPFNALKTCPVEPQCIYYTNNKECEKCDKGFVNFKGKCIDICPNGYYKSKIDAGYDFTCKPCDLDCENCISKHNCTICVPGLIWFNGKCVNKCPDESILKKVNGTEICELCDPECLLCTNNQDKCLICKANFYTYEGKCIKECPEGYYKDELKKSCVKCDDPCLICESSNFNKNDEQCTKCKAGYVLRHGRCVDDCGYGFYKNNDTLRCEPCTKHCLNCRDNPSNCTKCEDGYNLTSNLGDNKKICVNKCPVGHVMVNAVCQPCTDVNCNECSQRNPDTCRVCKNSTVLKEGKCVPVCGDNYFLNLITNKCEKCNLNCAKCTSNDKCLNCDTPKLLLNDNSCVDKCPDGYVQSGSVCVKCQNIDTCKQCTVSNLNICDLCYHNQYLYEGACVDKCPDNYIPKHKKCIKCPEWCDSCKDSNTCKKCKEGYYLKNDLCVKDCEDGYVLNQKSNECEKCRDTKCKTCSIVNPNNCIECTIDNYLYKMKCDETCPAGTYTSQNRTCVNCKGDCLECNSDYDCTKCQPGTYLLNNKCVSRCDEAYTNIYGTSKECIKCSDPNCKKCDRSADKCDDCTNNKTLFDSQCIDTCPDGYFYEMVHKMKKCSKCDSICSKCVNNKKHCVECISPFVLDKTNNTCTGKCPQFYAQDPIDNTKCNLCSPFGSNICKQCNPYNVKECWDCKEPYKLDFNTKTCIRECIEGYYQPEYNLNTCKQCQDPCVKCENKSGICEKCKFPYYLINNQCVKNCPNGYVEEMVDNQSKCKPCDDEICINCNSENTGICYDCDKPMIWQDNKCVHKCKNNYYRNKQLNKCIQCVDTNCEKCSLSSNGNTCNKCSEGYFLQDGKCVYKCELSFYNNKYDHTCEKCLVPNCNDCSLDKKSCKQCIDDYYYNDLDKSCVKPCPLNTFSNKDTKTCDNCSNNCLICNSKRNCQKCDSSTLLYQGRCFHNCPYGFVRNYENDSCIKCDDDHCLKCIEKDKCINCKSPYILNNNTCTDKCPPATYYDVNKNECKTCSKNCIDCPSFDKCNNCTNNTTLVNGKKCEDKCQPNTVLKNAQCIPCKTNDPNCIKCSVQDVTQCTDCKYPMVLQNNTCFDKCSAGYYYEDSRICKNCPGNCTECPNDKECKTCNDNYYLLYNKCVPTCPSGYFAKNGICLPCGENCDVCTDADHCTLCHTPLLSRNGECKTDCNDGYYLPNGQNLCAPCSLNCTKCTNSDNCIECIPGSLVNQGKCTPECDVGWVKKDGKCLKCDPDCQKCDPSDIKRCFQCTDPNKVILNGECKNQCPPGMGYYVDTDHICKKCKDPYCIECSSGREKTCTKCELPKLLFNNTCVDNCTVGMTKVNNNCTNCDTTDCMQCEEENSKKCIKCVAPKFLLNNTCLDKCPNMTYKDDTKCSNCDTSCKVCFDKDNCEICKDGFDLVKIETTNSYKCLSPCGPGKTMMKNGTCSPCTTPNCLECPPINTSICNKCQANFYMVNISQVYNCTDNCLKGMFLDSSKINCKNCSSDCKECESEDICKICKDGLIWNNGKCVIRCPTGSVERNLQCIPCNSTDCKECDNINTSKCKECVDKYIQDDVCVSACSTGYYENTVNGIKYCTKCSDNCDKCDNESKCTICKSSYKLYNRKCIKPCPDGTVEDDNNNCKQCIDDNCKICDKNNQAKCINCKNSYVLLGDKCYSNCPPGNFQSSDGSCYKCLDNNCLNCNPSTICSECKPPRFLASDGTCVRDCPSGTTNMANYQCAPCTTPECSECAPNEPTKCTKCSMNMYLQFINGLWKCTVGCGQGTYSNPVTHQCEKCDDPKCIKCSIGVSQCEQCVDNFAVINGKCSDNCKDGYIMRNSTVLNTTTGNNDTFQTCDKCQTNSTCLKCDQTLKNCIHCDNTTLLYDKKCVLNCPEGTIMSRNKKYCKKCDFNCAICAGTYDNCTSCNSPYLFNPSTKKCTLECDDGYVKINQTCVKCNTDNNVCKTCSENNLNICKLCKGKYVLYNSTCIDICPSGTYMDQLSNTCINCNPHCKVCNFENNNITSCKDCEVGFYLNSVTGECQKNCTDGFFKNYSRCDLCTNPRCKKCDVNYPNKCHECPDGKVLYKGDCLDACLNDTYLKNKTCIPCTNDCVKCNIAGTCDICQSPLQLLDDGSCGYPQCKEGTVLRDGVCIPCADPNCAVCNPSKLTDCKHCEKGFSLLNNKCVVNCTDNNFVSSNGLNCEPCSLHCRKCKSNKNCDICQQGFYKLNNQCVDCSDKSYVIVGDSCIPCNVENCDKCVSGTSDKCEVCRPDKSLTSDAKCVDNCPDGTYRNTTTSSCINCNKNCTKCDAGTGKCKTCVTSMIELNGDCVDKCPDGYVQYTNADSTSFRCRKCRDSQCLQCDSDHPEKCIKCNNQTFLYNGQCNGICPSGTLLEDNECQPCEAHCANCEIVGIKNRNELLAAGNGTSNNTEQSTPGNNGISPVNKPPRKFIIRCINCDPSYKYDKKQQKCVSECSPGSYETSDNKCVPCKDTNCIKCSPSDVCRQCNNDTLLDKTTDTCVKVCTPGFYKNLQTGNCEQCDKNCKMCRDLDRCYDCKDGYVMNNTTCVDKCPLGMTKIGRKCENCSQTECDQCEENRPDKCTHCFNNTNTFLENGVCIANCPNGTYANITTGKCESCSKRCQECSNSTVCTTCRPEFVFKNKKCMNKCTDNKVEVDGKCLCCDDKNCKNCYADLKTCIKCFDKFFLSENSCLTVCPVGYFKNNKKECEKCSQGCELCMSTDKCSKCFAKFFLNNDYKCVQECPVGFYGDCTNTGNCLKCNVACESCIDNSNSNCPSCATGFYKSNNLCISKENCIIGTYPDVDRRECVSCRIPRCEDCLNKNTCAKCIKGYELSKDSTNCIESKSLVNILRYPVIFSEHNYDKFNTYNEYSFAKQLKNSCIDSKSFTISFWLRLISNEMSNNPVIFEIQDNNKTDLTTKSDDEDIYDASRNRTINKGLYINFMINNTNNTLVCSSLIKNTNSSFSIGNQDCSFLKLNHWNFFAISINKEKGFHRMKAGLVGNEAFFKLSTFDTATNSSDTFKSNSTNSDFVFDQDTSIISKNSNLYLNSKFKTNPIFEISRMNVMEHIPNKDDLQKFINDKPVDCDYMCSKCEDKCYSCSNSPAVLEGGYCPATFVSLSPNLVRLDSPLTTAIRKYNIGNYLASDRYSFVSNFYIKSTNDSLASNVTETTTNNIKLFNLHYRSNNIITVEIQNSFLFVKISNTINSTYSNSDNPVGISAGVDKSIKNNQWYIINISVTQKIIYVTLTDSTNSKTLIKDEIPISSPFDYILRIAPDAEITVNGNSTTNNTIILNDARFYINNIISTDEVKKYLSNKKCSENCAKCDNNLNCVLCQNNYELNNLSGTCEIKGIGRPNKVFARKSVYDFKGELLDNPFTLAGHNFTFATWMRKTIPSWYLSLSTDPSKAHPEMLNNLISFMDSTTNKVLPLLRQQVLPDLSCRYFVDPSYLVNAQGQVRNLTDNTNFFHRYLNSLNDVPTQTPITVPQLSFSNNYKNTTPGWFFVGISSKVNSSGTTFRVYINDTNSGFSDYINFTVNPSVILNNSLIVGDKTPQINMEYGPIELYYDTALGKTAMARLVESKPKEFDPSCLDVNHKTGYCNLCAIDNLQGYNCNPFWYGFKKAAIYDEQSYNNIIKPSTKKFRLEMNPEYNTILSDVFKKDINSKEYSVIGWFQLFSKIKNKSGESVLFRLSNADMYNIKEDSPYYSYYPGINLITMKLVYNSTFQPSYVFVVSQYNQDRVIPIENLTVRENEWLGISAGIDVNNRVFNYKVYSQIDNMTYSANYTLDYYPQVLQEISTLKLFGVNSLASKNALQTYGLFFNFYVLVNAKSTDEVVAKYRSIIDPTLISVDTNNSTNSFSCDSSCSKCLVGSCFECQTGYSLNNNLCVLTTSLVNYLLLTDQNNANTQNSKIVFPSKVATGQYGFQFSLRRNYMSVAETTDTISRAIVELGSLKLYLVTSPGDAYIKIESLNDGKSSTTLGSLDSNSAVDYNWHTVLMNVDQNNNNIKATLFDVNNTVVDTKSFKFTQGSIPYDNIALSNLNYEITLYGVMFILNNNQLSLPHMNKPAIDCPVDCTFCEKNNMCKQCTYGLECDINDPIYKVCKQRYLSMNSMDISAQNALNNRIVFSDFLVSNKLIRFKQFSLVFSVSLTEGFNYNNILKIINNPDTNMVGYNPTNINYNVISLSYKTDTKTFIFSYHNRLTSIKFQNPISTPIASYKSTNSLRQIHYFGISYDSIAKKMYFALYNSEYNTVTDSIPIIGEIDNFGTYTNFVFLDDFLKLNSKISSATASVTNIRYLYESSNNEKTLLDKITTMAKLDTAKECLKTDQNKVCLQCTYGKMLYNGLCLSENIQKLGVKTNPFVFYPNSPVTTYSSGDIKNLVMTGYAAETTSFTLQFLYKKISYAEDSVVPILSISLVDLNKITTKNFYEIFEINNNHLVGIAKVFGTKDLTVAATGYVDSGNKFTWLFISIDVDIISKTNSISIYNYSNSKLINGRNSLSDSVKYDSMKIPADSSLAINYDLSKSVLTINKNIINNPSVTNLQPGHNTEFEISSIGFYPNYLYTDLEVINLRPSKPIDCLCGCACVNNVCPEQCKIDKSYIDLTQHSENNGLLFNPIMTYIKNTLNNNFDTNDMNLNTNSEDTINKMNHDMTYYRFTLSFTMNVQSYLNNVSQKTVNLNRQTDQNDASNNFFLTPKAKRNVGLISTGFGDPATGSQSATFSSTINSPITTATATSTSSAQTSKSGSVSDPNSDIIFMLSNQYSKDNLNMKTTQKLSENMIDYSIFTVRIVNNKLRFYVGSDRFTEYVSYKEVDMDISNVSKMVALFFVDTTKNTAKLILYTDDLRSDVVFEYAFSVEYINMRTVFYSSSLVNNLVINLAANIDKHLNYLKPLIESNFGISKFCGSCKNCHKDGNRCIVCGFKTRLYNNTCMDVSNVSDYSYKKKKRTTLKLNSSKMNYNARTSLLN